ncbi:MAG: acetyl-CoA carboxylase, carboxyltransferase subunit beta [Elusimicrobiota bacterium]|jgi:acetyl-CoA carboxylase carboxyl transferase subunit beta|nr:acetyl-CoA carboxylase, carboxyltransferase subunit beta [Elusimicrobiota bacterium]
MVKRQKDSIDRSEKRSLPSAGLWAKCPKCDQILLQKDYEGNYFVCPKCGHYARLQPRQRINITVDADSFEEFCENILPVDFLKFPGYGEKIKKTHEDAIITGKAEIGGQPVVIAVMDFGFMGGSMGSVVGEKIVRAVEYALKKKYPVIIVSASGGARMQEGLISLMQMGKTNAALSKLARAGLGYISLLTDPTTGGVAASFAMIGDINIAETGALVGFAGPRVIEQTIRQQLPDGFQRPEFLRNHGMVDMIVERKDIKDVLIKLLRFFVKNEVS